MAFPDIRVPPDPRRVRRRWRSVSALAALCLLLAATATDGAAATEPLSPVGLGDAPILKQPTPLGDVTYVPGRGLRLGDTGLTLGGYTSMILSRPEGERGAFEIDPISLFAAWDPHPRFHVVSELQYDDVFEVDERGHTTATDNDLTVERLYTDLSFSDLLNVRAGIFLTPVGRWNVIHIAPLVWTTEQPISTELPFDPNLTGVMLHGSLYPGSGVLTYALYDQFAGPVEGDSEFEPADHSTGGRLEYTLDTGWSVGASYLASRRDAPWHHLGGLDLLWSHAPFEIMGELVIEEGGGDEQWGGYLQGVYALTHRVSLVGRFEHYAFPALDPSVNLVTLGVAFRPVSAIVLKAEYVIADRRNPEAAPGLYASMATLF
jgi:hypothetical protein